MGGRVEWRTLFAASALFWILAVIFYILASQAIRHQFLGPDPPIVIHVATFSFGAYSTVCVVNFTKVAFSFLYKPDYEDPEDMVLASQTLTT